MEPTTMVEPEPVFHDMDSRGPRVLLVMVMGCTCAGKTTLIEAVKKENNPRFGTVEVGQYFRKKYPPEHFQGSLAPAHTQEEAWEAFVSMTQHERDKGKRIIFVDGQPRTLDQVKRMVAADHPVFTNAQVMYVMLYASQEVREHRARANREGGSLELALQRMRTDAAAHYDILMELQFFHKNITIFDTAHVNYSTDKVLAEFRPFAPPM